MSFSFSDIVFSNEQHSYSYNGKSLVSVTRFKSTVVPAFDEDAVSLNVALRDGISQDEVLKTWKETKDRSADKGTRLHQYVEDKLKGIHDNILSEVNDRIPEMIAFDAAWQKMQKLEPTVIHLEHIIGDPEYEIAGTIDAVISIADKKHIFDWKTGKFTISNNYSRLLPPFEDLHNSKLAEYSIQTSLYRYIYEKYTKEQLGNSYLLHLRSDGSYHFHRAFDLRDRIDVWFDGKTARDICADPKYERQANVLIEAVTRFAKPETLKYLSNDTIKKFRDALILSAKVE
jgi:hypothetical protein